MQVHRDSIPNIKRFEYKKHNMSVFSARVLAPIATAISTQIPEGTNTNWISITGASVLTLVYFLTLIIDISRFSFILVALALPVYQILDTLNQEVAVRDQTKSALTIFVDHMCDHWACCLITLTFCNLTQISLQLEWIVFPIVGIIPFYLKYLNMCYQDKMTFDMFNPFDQGLVALQLVCWVTVATGTQIWIKQILMAYVNQVFFVLVLSLAIVYTVRVMRQLLKQTGSKNPYLGLSVPISTLYIFIQYIVLTDKMVGDLTVVRMLEWTFAMVHTIIIGRLLVFYMAEEKLKPISFQYLFLAITSIVLCSIIHFVDIPQVLVICNFVTSIVFLLVFGYSLLWTHNAFVFLDQAIKS